jgi:hypothetical protein
VALAARLSDDAPADGCDVASARSPLAPGCGSESVAMANKVTSPKMAIVAVRNFLFFIC